MTGETIYTMRSAACTSAMYSSASLFTGKERDQESGLDNFTARYYSGAMGRFLSPDPSGLYYADPTNPQSLNLYSYVQNNPLINTDLNGLRCVWDDGSFDAEDDPSTGENAVDSNGNHTGCTGQGGTWYAPGTYAPGVDWASTNSDGTLMLHGASPTSVVNVFGTPPGAPSAIDDFLTSTIEGKSINLINNSFTFLIFPSGQRDYGPQKNWLDTYYCGPGGSGPTGGIINSRCAIHDKCFENAGIDANGNTPGGPDWSLSQAAAAQGCNQALYNAARANPLEAGSKALQEWLTKGDAPIPFSSTYVLKPGTAAKSW